MATIVAARAAGAGTVIVTGTSQDRSRLDVALRAGADHVIDVETDDPVGRVAELTDGRMADVVIDAASGNPVTVTLAMELVRRGGNVVIAGMKDRRPVEGFISDWIPMRQITIHPGAGLDVEKAVRVLNAGEVPTTELLGEAFTLDRFEEAFAVMTRQIPGRDLVRVALRLNDD
jgi:threonine dehydrogenase-like Zn-dependent dehydrogenase